MPVSQLFETNWLTDSPPAEVREAAVALGGEEHKAWKAGKGYTVRVNRGDHVWGHS